MEDKVEEAVSRVQSAREKPLEIGRMVNLGLGRGVDATNHTPWLNKSSFQVRMITPYNIIGTDEGGILQTYVHEVFSIQTMQANLNASVPIDQQVSVNIDNELSQSSNIAKRSVGKKIITRTISFVADFDDFKMTGQENAVRRKSSIAGGGDNMSGATSTNPASLLTFEERLARWILERMSEEEVKGVKELKEQDDYSEVLATFLSNNHKDDDKMKIISNMCCQFVEHFCITHYASAITLGALQYRVMNEEEYQSLLRSKGSYGIEQMVTKEEIRLGKKKKSSELTKIGRIIGNKVKRGTADEAVVEIKLQPISALVKIKALKSKLQKAIKKYIDTRQHSKAGPFIISCNNDTIFLKVIPTTFNVVATMNIEESSNFFVSSSEDRNHPHEFSIMYIPSSCLEEQGVSPIPLYLYAPVNALGKNNGPLTFRLAAKDTKTNMTLNHRRTRHLNPADPKDWVNSREIFYICCKQRIIMRNGYICVKKKPLGSLLTEEFITCCVPSIKKHNEERNCYMLFRLLPAGRKDAPRVRKEVCQPFEFSTMPKQRREEREMLEEEQFEIKQKKKRESFEDELGMRTKQKRESFEDELFGMKPKPKKEGTIDDELLGIRKRRLRWDSTTSDEPVLCLMSPTDAHRLFDSGDEEDQPRRRRTTEEAGGTVIRGKDGKTNICRISIEELEEASSPNVIAGV